MKVLREGKWVPIRAEHPGAARVGCPSHHPVTLREYRGLSGIRVQGETVRSLQGGGGMTRPDDRHELPPLDPWRDEGGEG